MSKDTVSSYIDLLEKSFVLYVLHGYSRNLKKEVTKKSKIYFYDTGIRNALIDNFNLFSDRNDTAILWENFLVMERIKKNSYQGRYPNYYFWRTHTGAELDFVEESAGKLFGFEFKFSSKIKKAPASWLNTYQEASFDLINRENFLNFLL